MLNFARTAFRGCWTMRRCFGSENGLLRRQENTLIKSCKVAPVSPEFPRPQCDCSNLAWIKQSTHPSTVARAHYMCKGYRPNKCCCFFQWIGGPDKYDKVFMRQKYMLSYAVAPEEFTRWRPPSTGSREDKGKTPMVPDAPIAPNIILDEDTPGKDLITEYWEARVKACACKGE